jgi:hypothetical protein
MNDTAVERGARALYVRMGGSQGYAKNGKTGWDALSKAQRRPWIADVRAVLAACEEKS